MSSLATLPDPSALAITDTVPNGNGRRRLIETGDAAWFSGLGNEAKTRLKRDLSVMFWVEQALALGATKKATWSEASRRMRQAPGFSAKAIERKHYTWVKAGRRPHALLNQAVEPPRERGGFVGCHDVEAFLAWWRYLVGRKAGIVRNAYHMLLIPEWNKGLDRFEGRGIDIPGYGNPDEWLKRNGHLRGKHLRPRGWSFQNMARFALDPFERTIIQIGPGAAREHLPGVLQTRLGVPVGKVLIMDDMWENVELFHQGDFVRPLGLALTDFASARREWGAKPRAKGKDGRYNNIVRDEVRFFLANYAAHIGFHPSGSMLFAETGAMGVDKALAADLLEYANVKVIVGSIDRRHLGDAFFQALARGNPRHKARLESDHGYRQNSALDLLENPGHTGRNSRLDRPEELEARKVYALQLITEARRIGLPQNLIDQLQMPTLSWDEWYAYIGKIHRAVERNHEHELEGWDDDWVDEFLPGPDARKWLPLSELDKLAADQRDEVLAWLQANKDLYTRSRRLSRGEKWRKGLVALRPLPGYQIVQLLAGQYSRELRVTNQVLSWKDSELSRDTLVYFARLVTRDGLREFLPPGEDVVVSANPWDLSKVYVTDRDGRYLGEAPRWDRISPLDREGIERAQGRQSAAKAFLSRRLPGITEPLAERRRAMLAHNEEILSQGREAAGPATRPKATRRPPPMRAINALLGAHSSAVDDYDRTQP